MAKEKPTWWGAGNKLPLDADRDPWEMQSGEGSKAFADFCEYRNMPPASRQYGPLCDRMLARKKAEMEAAGTPMSDDAAKRYLKGCGVNYSRKGTHYRWRERVKAYDAHLDEKARTAREKAHTDAVTLAAKRHANVTMGLTLVANKRLAHFLSEKQSQLSEAQLAEMTFGDLIAMVKNGVMLERLVLDMGTSDDPAKAADPTEGGTRTVGITFEAAKAAARAALEEDAAKKKAQRAQAATVAPAAPAAAEPPPLAIDAPSPETPAAPEG